jgi:hypothetical protein
MHDAKGRAICELAGFTLETRDGVAGLRAKYAVSEWSTGQLPALSLSAEQCAALAGRLHACVLELKGAAPVTPLRRN